jgi:hypothetical protein
MPFRDLFLSRTMMALIPMGLFPPRVGIMVWSWIGYFRMGPCGASWTGAPSAST